MTHLKPKPTHLVFSAFVLALALLGGVAWLNLRLASDAQESVRWVGHAEEVRRALGVMLSVLQDVETGERGFVLTGTPEFLEPCDTALKAHMTTIGSLRTLMADNPEQQRNLTALEPLTAPTFRASPPMKRASSRSSMSVRSACWAAPPST